jgi:hypothetical protein
VVRLDPTSSVTPVATPTPSPTPTASTAPTAPATPTETAGPRGRVDVINGPRPVVIQIQTGGFTDAAAWSWLVPAGARLTLLDEPHAKSGYVRVLDVPAAMHSCGQLAYTTFSADPFTIVLSGPAAGGEYRMTLKVGTSLRGPVDTDYSPVCSG